MATALEQLLLTRLQQSSEFNAALLQQLSEQQQLLAEQQKRHALALSALSTRVETLISRSQLKL